MAWLQKRLQTAQNERESLELKHDNDSAIRLQANDERAIERMLASEEITRAQYRAMMNELAERVRSQQELKG